MTYTEALKLAEASLDAAKKAHHYMKSMEGLGFGTSVWHCRTLNKAKAAVCASQVVMSSLLALIAHEKWKGDQS